MAGNINTMRGNGAEQKTGEVTMDNTCYITIALGATYGGYWGRGDTPLRSRRKCLIAGGTRQFRTFKVEGDKEAYVGCTGGITADVDATVTEVK